VVPFSQCIVGEGEDDGVFVVAADAPASDVVGAAGVVVPASGLSSPPPLHPVASRPAQAHTATAWRMRLPAPPVTALGRVTVTPFVPGYGGLRLRPHWRVGAARSGSHPEKPFGQVRFDLVQPDPLLLHGVT